MKRNLFNSNKAFRFKRFVRKSYSAFNSMHKVVNIGVISGCVLFAANTTTISAQGVNNQSSKDLEKELDEVTVSASRIEMPIAQTAKLVTLISKQEIQQAPVQSIADLLNYVANIDLVQRGGHGVLADISIRGGNSDQTAILLNGINISNPQTGHYSLDIPINLSDIERIEILHGPSALVYGSSAFSGGINIITQKTPTYKLFADVESGMHNLKGIQIRGAKQTGIASHSLSVGYNSSVGYIDNSDYDLYNIFWQTQVILKNKSKINLQLGFNDKKYGANTFYTAAYPNQYEQTSTYLGTLKGEFGKTFKMIPIIYWNRHHDQFDLIRDSNLGRNYHRNDTYGVNLILSYRSFFGNTSLGGELRREDIISTKLGLPLAKPHGKYTNYQDRTLASLALEHTAHIDHFTLSAGAIFNHNTLDYDNKLYPSVSVNYRPTNDLKIYTSWSKSSRLPTYTELWYTTETHEGNSGLKTETSESFEVGFKYQNRLINAYATGFTMWGRNIIDWVKVNINGTQKDAAWNHTKVNTQGLELGVKLKLGETISLLGKDANIGIDYARMHQSANTNNYQSLYSLAYLRDKFTTHLSHQLYKNFTANWYFRFQKRMGHYDEYINNGNTGVKQDYPFFSTLDLKLNYKLNDINLYLEINNLYNTHYFDRGNIPQAGFWLMGGINYTLH